MRRLLLLACLALTACLPQLDGVDPARLPEPSDWGPNPAPTEWWYVSSYLPEANLAFHWALFKAYPPPDYWVGGLPIALLFPGPFHAAHLAVTDLATGQLLFQERSDFPRGGPASISFPPLRLTLDDWQLTQSAAGFHLQAGPLDVTLTPLKPPVVHPPGYSGDERVGRLYYQSYTRLDLEGHILGQEVSGPAWMDHQWGEQQAGPKAIWDWFGLHLDNGLDLMFYQVKDRTGQPVMLQGTWVDEQGTIHPLSDLRMTPLERWTSPSGRTYAVAWRVEADGLFLVLRPLRLEQELLTSTTRVAYWEGPVAGYGSWKETPVQAWGMGEFVAGPYSP
ncbi:MAG: carotenoid 1,2-hydratase [Deinococcus sp.]|nr:carotenoid 1,2-hydratase [Deinococcus sp.]